MAKKTSLPSGFTSKTNFQVLPGVPAGQKVNAATEWNLGIQDLADSIDANYERLILNWTNDIVVDQVLALGQYVDYNDQIYRVKTSYDVSDPKTFTAGNFQLLNLDLNTWFVNPNGDDTDGNGSPAKPFETIDAVSNVWSYGDTVILANGDYSDDFTVDTNINFVSLSVAFGVTLGAVIRPSTITINGGVEVTFNNIYVRPTEITQGTAGDVYIFVNDCSIQVTTITGLTLRQYQAYNCSTWFLNDLTITKVLGIIGGSFRADNVTKTDVGAIEFDNVDVFINGNLIKTSTGSLQVVNSYLSVDGNIDVGSENILQRNSVITVTGTIAGNVIPELQGLKKQAIGATLAIPFDKLITKIAPLTITGPTEFTVDTTDAEYGNMTFRRVTADGANEPIFAHPFQKWLASREYDNTVGVVNVMAWWFDGISYYYSIGQAEPLDTQAPTLSNYSIEDANKDRILFDSSEIITGTTFGGFTLADPTKTITGITIAAGLLTGHYFTVSVAYDSGDASPTIAYSGSGSDIEDIAENVLESFTATAITNNIAVFANTKSIDFNGSTQHLVRNQKQSELEPIGSSSTMSWSFWIKPVAVNDNRSVIWIGRDDITLGNGIVASLINSSHGSVPDFMDFIIYGSNNTKNLIIRSGAAFTAGSWYHVVITYDEATKTLKLYRNAVESGNATTDNSFDAYVDHVGKRFRIGNQGFAGNPDYYEGLIDEIAVYDKVLNQGEVTAIYDSGTPNDLSALGSYSNNISWWRMEDDLTDENSGYTLTNIGSTPFNADIP